MIELLTDEQGDRIFQRLILSASDILAEEFALPKKTFAEIQEMIEKQEEDSTTREEGNPSNNITEE